MVPVVLDARNSDDPRDLVHRAVQSLVEGQLVVFPTETVYGVAASALNEQAVERLIDLKLRGPGHPLTLAIKSADDALDYAPRASALGRRLARRCWPGPVTLVLDGDHPDSLVQRLPHRVQEAISPAGSVGLRVPAHDLITEVLRLLAGPLTLTSANRAGCPDAVNAQEAVQAIGDCVPLILDDGPCQFGQPSTVVQVRGREMTVLREGVVSKEVLNRLANCLILLVCTGNTCRSPMAELLCRNLIAKKLDCAPDEIIDRGVTVASAGVAAAAGCAASPEAIQVMADRGLDLSRHSSQPISRRLAQHADVILTMTDSHRAALLSMWPDLADRLFVLRTDGNVSDPIGGPRQLYEQCAQQMEAALAERLETLDCGIDDGKTS